MNITQFITIMILATFALNANADKKPNILYILADQWRAQATGYAGDPNLLGKTPNLDKLEAESINFTNAVSGAPVCTPYRASLLTGQYPLTHGLFLNDLQLPNAALTLAEVLRAEGYNTGFIGKWHLDGHGRRRYIPADRRQGFEYWKVLECTHSYNDSYYYEGDNESPLRWEDYDALAQTKDAAAYIQANAKSDKPFALILSWGPPHNPYESAPEKYKEMFSAKNIKLRPNVNNPAFRKQLAGYYAHIAALDDYIGNLLKTLDDLGIADNTIVVFTSDHGDMIGSQSMERKQKPWDESIRVPFLLRFPNAHGATSRHVATPINTPDIMPTLLGLANVGIPESVEGIDFAPIIQGRAEPNDGAAILSCIAPFGEWHRGKGGREFRGIRTERYTYARTLEGPWLLYDNDQDPYQLENLLDKPEYASLQDKLDARLLAMLTEQGDAFLPAENYIKEWGYEVNTRGTIPYTNELPE